MQRSSGGRSGREDPAVAYGKRRRYGRSRSRRRRGAVVLVVIAGLLAALPFVLRAPEEVRKAVYPLRYEETIRETSEEYGLEPAFVAGVVYTESRFRPDAESHREAYGLMQLLPQTAEFIGKKSGIKGDYRVPEVNLRLGTWYLAYLEGRYQGDERLMLAAYNSGEGSVDGWLSREGFDVAKDIPFKETREYVDDVLEARQTYRELYGRDLDRNSE